MPPDTPRLQQEMTRLFGAHDRVSDGGYESEVDHPWDAPLVLEVTLPAGWAALAPLWHGVQSELGLPPPAIAVNGRNAFQLWFGLQQAVPRSMSLAFWQQLRQRFLPNVDPRCVRTLPSSAAGWGTPVPPRSAPDTGHWCAFVTPDLAPVFAEEPWLDIPPNADGQADLLTRLKGLTAAQLTQIADQATTPSPSDAISTKAQPCATFATAISGDRSVPAAQPPKNPLATPPAPMAGPLERGADTASAAARTFLLQVMSDTTADLALRVDCAKALLRKQPASPS